MFLFIYFCFLGGGGLFDQRFHQGVPSSGSCLINLRCNICLNDGPGLVCGQIYMSIKEVYYYKRQHESVLSVYIIQWTHMV